MPVRQQRPTLRDVAEAAGVSKTTAVFVLNERPNFSIPEETRTRVHNAAKRLGYRRNGLAAALSRGRTGSLGILLSAHSDARAPALGQEWLLAMLLGATRAAAAAGLRLTTILYAFENPPIPEEVTDQRVDGLLLVGILDETFARALHDSGFPCVTIGSGYAQHRVSADNFGGARQAVEHLIGLGHRRIAYASAGRTEAERERGEGWRETMRAHGLPTEGLEQDWAPLRERLQSSDPDRPTAVFCRNDSYAAVLIRASQESGLRVPEDLSIVGFDDSVVAEALNLTSVRNPLAEQTAHAVEILNRLIAGEEAPALVTVSTSLTIRRTTAPLRPQSYQKEL